MTDESEPFDPMEEVAQDMSEMMGAVFAGMREQIVSTILARDVLDWLHQTDNAKRMFYRWLTTHPEALAVFKEHNRPIPDFETIEKNIEFAHTTHEETVTQMASMGILGHPDCEHGDGRVDPNLN